MFPNPLVEHLFVSACLLLEAFAPQALLADAGIDTISLAIAPAFANVKCAHHVFAKLDDFLQ